MLDKNFANIVNILKFDNKLNTYGLPSLR